MIGLGYVGLPLAVEFGKKIKTIGFDLNQNRVWQLKQKKDVTKEILSDNFDEAKYLTFTSHKDDLFDCNVYIIAVPTPVDKYNNPDFNNLIEASKFVVCA